MMRRLLAAAVAVLLTLGTRAQLLTWTPDFPRENDNITITVDATKGNQGLLGFTGNVYVHVGLITSLSSNEDDWKYVPFTWGTTPVNGQATAAGTNKWTYTINNIRSFFNVTNPSEQIRAIAILFRSGTGDRVQRNSNTSVFNGNMYVPVYDNGLHIRFTQPPLQPYFQPIPEQITRNVGQDIAITGVASQPSDMQIFFNGNSIQTATAVSSISANPAITAAGNQELVIEVVNGSTTKRDTIEFFVAGAVNVAPLPAGTRDGINYLTGNTSVVLVLRAPGKNRVSVIGEFPGNNWTEQSQYQMSRTPDGQQWWIQIDGLTPGTEYAYQYLVDGSLKIADPYAEKILDPFNNNDQFITAATYPGLRTYPAGQSGIVSLLQTNAPAYNWVNNSFARPDKRGLFIYEMLLRDFVAAHDWNTLRDTLTYLKRLGVNAIELMPFNEFEGNESWGYNPDFYFAPDKYYGPRNTLKRFVDECHGLGIAVIMDIALNHSFGLSPMVQLYWDAANNRPANNNPWYNPVAKHAFNVGFDMNHESAATNYFFSRVVEHWLQEYKLDGFRFDLSKGFTQVQTCDANGGNCNVGNWGNYDASRVAIWKKYYDTLMLKSPNSYVILEHFAANNEEIELSNYGMMLWGNIHYNFSEAAKGVIANSNFEGALHSVRGWTQPNLISYMESHDEERLAYLNINQGLSSGAYNVRDTSTSLKRLATSAAFLLGMPGPKMIWQFGELGYDFPINYCPNGTINNDCRTANKPIRWDYKSQARRQALYDVYSEMARLRQHGWYKDVFTANNISIERSLGGAMKWLKLRSANDSSMVCIIGNFELTAQAVSFTFPSSGTWYDYFGNTAFTSTGAAQTISLQPGEFVVYVNRNVDNITVTPVFDVDNPANQLLAAVYPNPVSAGTLVELNIPAAANTQMELLDMGGRRLQAVYSGNLNRGNHLIPVGDQLRKLARGLYLLRITAGKDQQILKLMIP
jgi:1,4-alpha-glucan branching enzyme